MEKLRKSKLWIFKKQIQHPPSHDESKTPFPIWQVIKIWFHCSIKCSDIRPGALVIHLPNTTVNSFIVFLQLGWQPSNLHNIKQTFSSTDVNSQEINADRAKLHKSQKMWSNNTIIIITRGGKRWTYFHLRRAPD